jgi:hypothetical protein
MAEAAVAILRDFVAREPAAAARLGKRRMARALALRLARLAAQEERAGNADAARAHLREATHLVPWGLRYRLRLLGAGRRMPSL